MNTHCKHGHELTPENAFQVNNGAFRCRECVRLMSLGCQLERDLGLMSRKRIEQQTELLIQRQQDQDRNRVHRQLEKTYAQGNESRPVLPAGESEGGEQGEGGADLPSVDGSGAGNGKAAEAQAPLVFGALPKNLNAVDLAVTVPPRRQSTGAKPDAAFMTALRERMTLYKQDGLDALRDLAMMPISTNSMQNQVKFLAASKLVGNLGEQDGPATGAVDTLLKQLNEEYRTAAPKIREVRERVITFDETKVIN